MYDEDASIWDDKYPRTINDIENETNIQKRIFSDTIFENLQKFIHISQYYKCSANCDMDKFIQVLNC